jgi:succinate dehydrogenase/fumarate reductase cytochrome b subunit
MENTIKERGMLYSSVLDSVAGVVLAYFLIVGVMSFVIATFVEAVTLWVKGWGSFLRALLTSFIMNLASTLVGYLLATVSGSGLEWRQKKRRQR